MAEHPSRRPKKARLGQNFLVSPSAPGAIVEALGDLGGATVVEIGPGKGAITRLLAARSQHLIAVEFDRSLAEALRADFSGHAGGQVEILSQDILRVDLRNLIRRPPGRLVVVGNLPYYITSDILLHLFAHHTVIERAVLMVQREVAERIVAQPGVREYGLLSATTQMYARVESLFDLPPHAFSPAPKVYSTVFRLTMQPRFAELRVDEQGFLEFLRRAFAQKRKTLANNLRAALHGAAEIHAALIECHVDPLSRAEAISLETMAAIFHSLESKRAATSRG
jgi:16S rRNA (adenine1518-N6/adenine1519-N6)-dimethyltransferase